MSYDYTQHDRSDAQNEAAEIDNFEIADNSAPTQTAEEIRLDNSYNDVPPGQHTLMLHSFASAPKNEFYKVVVDGMMMSYTSPVIRVRFCLPNQPKTTIEDYFVLPPAAPSEMPAYIKGVPPGKKAAGFNAKKFYQFIGALGFPYPPGGNLPPEARKLGNWKGRTIQAVAQKGQPYEEKVNGVPTGNMKEGRPQIKLFSYLPTDSTAEALSPASANYGQPQAARSNYPAPPSIPNRGPAPQAVGAGTAKTGLDDL